MRVDVTVRVDRDGSRVILVSEGAPRELEVRQGRWSDWLRVKFKLGLLQSVRGMVRFHLVGCEPELTLYASPVNFDPDSPPFPISEPPEFAGELAGRIGPYYTTGMVEDHAGLNNERISEEAFLDQCAIAWNEREAMMLHELESVRRGTLLLPLRHARPRPAPVLAVPRARPPGQPRRGSGPRVRSGHRRLLPPLRRRRRQGTRVRRRRDPLHRAFATTASTASGAACI